VLLFAMVLVVSGVVQFPRQATYAATVNWATYLGNDARTGFNGQETVITPTTAPTLKLLWTAKPLGAVSSEMVVVNNVGYYGSWDGALHATNLTTGQDYWSTPLGTKPGSCTPLNYGITGTPTIATIGTTQMAFVAGGQDNVTAVNTSTGKVVWQTNLGNAKGQFIYGSTVVYNGSVYTGMGDFGDCPLVQGQLYQLNATTGQIQHTFNAVPNGCIGAGVWSSPAIDDATGMLYFTTGNADPKNCKGKEPLASAIVELNTTDLSLVSSWQATANGALDYDIGATPTLFTATIGGVTHQMIGVVSKDGNYYALDRTNLSVGPLWKATISVAGSGPETGNGSISSGSYDGTYLYQAGGITTINGQKCMGSLRAMDPNTGNFIWQICLSSPVLDPVISSPGLVVVGWAKNMYVVNSATGQNLFTYVDTTSNARFWGAATISNGVLYDGSRSGKLFAFGVPGTPPPPTPSPTESVTATPSPGTTLAQDTFVRNPSSQSLWGTASDGQIWGADANTLSNFTINNDVGQVAGSGTASKSYTGVLGPPATNAEVLISGSLSSFGGNTLGAVLHWSASNNFYKAYINGSNLVILKMVNGVITRLASVTFNATAGASYMLLFSVSGSSLAASAWPSSGTQPGSWMVTASDGSLSSGSCGLLVYLANGVTAAITSFQATSVS
jgi:polyvinyl alcohol dehydrogenase (cytochrome)